jgi:hypothetical protein
MGEQRIVSEYDFIVSEKIGPIILVALISRHTPTLT